MRVTNLAAVLAALILLSLSSLASDPGGPTSPSPQIHVPNRPGKPLFAGEQGRQRTEINYDRKTRMVTLRLVVLLFSSGIDTFSKASYADTLRAAGRSDVPIYVLNIGPMTRNDASVYGLNGPYTRLDWKGAEQKLSQIAQASGGRMYSPGSSLDLTALYDDLMENLRVRYVITYKSTAHPEERGPRIVRVELVDPSSGGPVRIVDADGKPVQTKVLVEGGYNPAAADTGTNPDR